MKEFRKIVCDGALITSRDWEEVHSKPLSQITGNPEDKEQLDGIIIRGYESKFADGTNTNGERFSTECLDKFIREYYIEKGLNIPLDVEHNTDPEWLCGRVVYAEVNDIGFMYAAYIPRTYMHYEDVKALLANKILQGFSKFGWCSKGHWVDDEHDEEYGGYFYVEEMVLLRLSLVANPANGIPFDEVGEVSNAIRFVNKTTKKSKVRNGFAAMFN